MCEDINMHLSRMKTQDNHQRTWFARAAYTFPSLLQFQIWGERDIYNYRAQKRLIHIDMGNRYITSKPKSIKQAQIKRPHLRSQAGRGSNF